MTQYSQFRLSSCQLFHCRHCFQRSFDLQQPRPRIATVITQFRASRPGETPRETLRRAGTEMQRHKRRRKSDRR